MTITEFLNARYDEEEAMALGVKHLPPVHPEFIAPDVGAIIIDPDRFLADIAAKRAIVALITESVEEPYIQELMLNALAQPYAERADFDPEWRVG